MLEFALIGTYAIPSKLRNRLLAYRLEKQSSAQFKKSASFLIIDPSASAITGSHALSPRYKIRSGIDDGKAQSTKLKYVITSSGLSNMRDPIKNRYRAIQLKYDRQSETVLKLKFVLTLLLIGRLRWPRDPMFSCGIGIVYIILEVDNNVATS